MLRKLKVVSRYVNLGRKLIYEEGTEIFVNDEEYRFLMADAGGCFKEIESPPKDKMMRKRRTKAAKED